MSPTPDKTDPRILRTRKRVESAFLELLDTRSLQSVTIQDIAQKADINRATFYDHYQDKYDLFDQLIHNLFMETINKHLSMDENFSSENLRKLVYATSDFFNFLNQQCSPFERMARPIAEAQVQHLLQSFFRKWLQETGNSKPQMKAAYISWAVFGVFLQWEGEITSQLKDNVFFMTEHLFKTSL